MAVTDDAGATITKIYENTNVTVKARIDKSDAEAIKEVTFKFLNDGKQFEEKAVTVNRGESSGGDIVVKHVVKAPPVPEDKYFYFLDYHYFYKVKNPDASTDSLQNFPASRIQVFPRTAQLKVTNPEGKAFHGFEFRVEQDGARSDVCKTLAGNTTNAKGETIPEGSCEFNLGLSTGFRIVASPPYQILEEVKADGRKREVKGAIGFRPVFLGPEAGTVKQIVNFDSVANGQTGIGDVVTIDVGVHPDDRIYLREIKAPTVYFRATFGPAEGPVVKSARSDDKNPTKILKPSASDTSVTIEEKEAKKKYQGKIVLAGGSGKLVASLGVAGGDTCVIEISGAEKFLTDPTVPPDATLQFENWRRVHYEMMVPDLLRDALDLKTSDFGGEEKRQFDELGRNLFIEFVHDKTNIFNTVKLADYGTLVPKRFLGNAETPDDVAYVLSGRNWKKLPKDQVWIDKNPGKTLHFVWCDKLLKWRTGTADEKAGMKDLSGTLKSAVGSIDVEDKFGGVFMPFSGFDGSEGVSNIHWTADITKDDAVCKCKPVMSLTEERYEDVVATGLSVSVESGEGLPARGIQVMFMRLPYPSLEVNDKTEAAEKDDGKLTLKDPALGQELALTFALPAEPEKKTETASEPVAPAPLPPDVMVLGDDDGQTIGFEVEFATHHVLGGRALSSSDWGEIPTAQPSDEERSVHVPEPVITPEHTKKLDDFFKKLFKDGKSKLSASAETNKFSIEIHGGKGDTFRTRRIAELRRAIDMAYRTTNNHEQYDFKKDLPATDAGQIQAFIEGLLEERAAIGMLKGKVPVNISCPAAAAHVVDDCFKAVKDKVKEVFDSKAKEFPYHPALDPGKDFAPREGDLDMAEITNVPKSSLTAWHFVLPLATAAGELGPAAFVGPEKTADQCPVKFEMSFQPHEVASGEAAGDLIAYTLFSEDCQMFVLHAFAGTEDKAAVAHGHGDKGKPGDCLKEDDELCEKCIAHGRSRNLKLI